MRLFKSAGVIAAVIFLSCPALADEETYLRVHKSAGADVSAVTDIEIGNGIGLVALGDGSVRVAATGASESDPVVGAVNGIIKADGSGNISAAQAGTDYVQSESDPVFAAVDHHTNWDSAYSWGNHADEGYLTGINWSAMPTIQSAGINWSDVDAGELQRAGVNWESIQTEDMSSTGVNWDSLVTVGGGESQSPWLGSIDADDNDLENLKYLYFSESNPAMIKVKDATTTDAAGKNLSIYAGKGNGAGSGGALQLFGGTDGAAAYGGGEIYVYGGTSSEYGAVELYDGSGNQGIQILTTGIDIYAVGFPIRFANSGYYGTFDFDSLQTADRTFTFPDASGEVALNKKTVYMKILLETDALTTGDGKQYFVVPAEMNGMNLTRAEAAVYAGSTSGLPTFQIRNVTDAVDMLSTAITIDENEGTSYTAATPSAVNASYDDVTTGDILTVDVDGAGTGVTGLDVILSFEAP